MSATPRLGQPVPDFLLPRLAGGDFHSREMLGQRWLLAFHRYAT